MILKPEALRGDQNLRKNYLVIERGGTKDFIVFWPFRFDHVSTCPCNGLQTSLLLWRVTRVNKVNRCSLWTCNTGEMGYVKHDLAKAIRTVLNSASGGFREQAADLKRVSDAIDMAESTSSFVLLFRGYRASAKHSG